MSMLSDIDDVTKLGDVELGVLLEQAEREERVVSKRRSALHERIYVVRAGGFASADAADGHLDSLQEAERELSERRALLHRQIDELRSELRRRARA